MVVAVAEHADEQAHLVQGPAGGGLDDREGLAGLSGVGVDDHPRHAGAYGDDAHGMGHDVMKLPGDLGSLVGDCVADLIGPLRGGRRCPFRGPFGLLAGIRPACLRILPGQPAQQHHSDAAYGGRDDLAAAPDEVAGQDHASREADDDQRGPAGRDGHDGVKSHHDKDGNSYS